MLIRRLTLVSIIGTAAIGLSVLVGWTFRIPLLKSVVPGAVEMKANTALGLVCGAVALFILERCSRPSMQRIGRAMAALVAVLGLATLGEYLFGWRLGIDELLFHDTGNAFNAIPGRMSPFTATAFASIGVAIAAFPNRRLHSVTLSGGMAAVLIGGVSLLGYLWSAKELTTDHWQPPVAVNTAVALLLLGMATLFAVLLKRRFVVRLLTQVEARVLVGFIGAAIMLFGIGWYTYWAQEQFAQTAQQVIQTQDTRSALGSLYEAISNVVFTQRNYLLTSDKRYRQAYQSSLPTIEMRLDELSKLIAANPSQLRRCEELRKLVTLQTHLLNQHVALFESADLPTVRTAIINDNSIAPLVATRHLIDEMDGVERASLAKRESIFLHKRQLSLVGILAMLFMATIVFILLFISIREETTKRMQADDEARGAIAAKEDFLATMSHEIRTPVNGMLGMLELLSLSQLDDRQSEFLSAARESGSGLVRIIDDVLDHAKINAGKLEIRLEPTSIPQIVRRLVGTYVTMASARDLAVVESIDARIPPWLLADAQRIAQILGNFVSNAIKFTRAGAVQVRVERLGTSSDGETIRFSVQDTGIGISEEAQKRLFLPFEQAAAETSRVYGGTGLGLAISRRLAVLMGGAIAVQSSVGEGTTMSLTLTLVACDMPVDENPDPIQPPLAGDTLASGAQPTVLMVDDHPTNRQLLENQLGSLGIRARAASNGNEALELWHGGGFDLVITDCNMPEMDGYALSRAIREVEAQVGGRIPIIAWTASVLAGAADRCRDAGMDDLLTKPANIAQLRQVLAKWIVIPQARRAAPIDQAALESLAGDEAGSAEILAEFVTQTTLDLAALDVALAAEDLAECEQVAHRIKGASRMVGARELAAASEAIEKAAGQGVSQVEALRPALDTALRSLVDYAATIASDGESHDHR